MLNHTKIVENDQISRIFDGVHFFAEYRLSRVMALALCVPIYFTIYENISTVLKKSHHTKWHQVAGLWPIVVMSVFLASAFTFSSEAWSSPALVIFTVGSFFCLCCTRIIICSVSKTEFSLLHEMHLTVPFLLSTAFIPINTLYLGYDEFSMYVVFIVLGLVIYF